MAQGPHRLALNLVQLAQNLNVAQLVEVELPLLLRCADLELQVCHLQGAIAISVLELAYLYSWHNICYCAQLLLRHLLHLLRHAYIQRFRLVACQGSIISGSKPEHCTAGDETHGEQHDS